jgi:hypothetical protein
MAVWQSTFYLVPKPEVIALFRTVPGFMDKEWFHEKKWYRNREAEIFEKAFDSMFPRRSGPKGSSNVLSWGAHHDNEIEMRVEDGKPTTLAARINADQVNMTFISSLVDFASDHDLLFWIETNGTFSRPVLDKFLESFRISRAMLFIRQPTVFFGDQKYHDALKNDLKKLQSDDAF